MIRKTEQLHAGVDASREECWIVQSPDERTSYSIYIYIYMHIEVKLMILLAPLLMCLCRRPPKTIPSTDLNSWLSTMSSNHSAGGAVQCLVAASAGLPRRETASRRQHQVLARFLYTWCVFNLSTLAPWFLEADILVLAYMQQLAPIR